MRVQQMSVASFTGLNLSLIAKLIQHARSLAVFPATMMRKGTSLLIVVDRRRICSCNLAHQ